MENMKVSLITTVLNEEGNINFFLESIKNQTKKPDEIIIVDADSKDKTPELIKEFFNKNKNLNGKLLIKKGNRSIGRNIAVKNAKFPIIAVTDVGCLLHKNWLKEIIYPFENSKSIDVVSGFYKPLTHNIFEKCLATYTSVMEDKIDAENFLPSSRSIAFKKNIFEKINGYPEFLNTCEDLVFDKKLKKVGAKFYFKKSALVYWPQRKDIFSGAKQFFSYAYGDGRGLYFRSTTPFLFLRYLIGIILLIIALQFRWNSIIVILIIGFIFYLIWSIFKNYKYVKNWAAFFYLPLLQIISDIMVISGMSCGIISRVNL